MNQLKVVWIAVGMILVGGFGTLAVDAKHLDREQGAVSFMQEPQLGHGNLQRQEEREGRQQFQLEQGKPSQDQANDESAAQGATSSGSLNDANSAATKRK